MQDLGALSGLTTGAHGQSDALMIHRHAWLGIAVRNGQQVPPTPQVVALSLDKAAGCFAGLVPK